MEPLHFGGAGVGANGVGSAAIAAGALKLKLNLEIPHKSRMISQSCVDSALCRIAYKLMIMRNDGNAQNHISATL
jgi:hypothetical protein